MKNLLMFIVLLAAAAVGWLWLDAQRTGDTPVAQGAWGGRTSVPVTVAPVVRASFADSVDAIGTARAHESVTITAKVTDKISSINFADGDRVEKGALLVELTNDEQAAQLGEAKADLKDARAQLQRLEDLARQGTVSAAQLDEARARFAIASSRLEGIVARLRDRVIRAPFAGVLGFRQVSPGTLVTPGTAITTLDDVSVLKLDFQVPELFIGAIDIGDPVTAFTPAYRELAFSGAVTGIGSRVDEVTRSVTVRAVLPNDQGRLRPGMLLTVRLVTDQREALAVPESAVVPADTAAYVYVIGSDDVAERRSVKIGVRSNDLIEIDSGLAQGERVAVLGLVKLRDGVKVDVSDATSVVAADN